MKGIIFNLLEDYIHAKYGEDIYELISRSADTGALDPFQVVSPGSYSDEAFSSLVDTAARLTGESRPDLLRNMGRHSLPRLANRYPQFFSGYEHPREFLKTAAMIHHVEVKKLYNDADVPSFFVEDRKEEGILFTYKSRRLLCSLVEGLIQGLGDHYCIPIAIQQTECMQTGSPSCKFTVQFSENQDNPLQ